MATVIYGGMALIPAPLVSFSDEPIIAGNQHRIGNTYRITINGTLISYKGSPSSASYAGGAPSDDFGGYNNQFWISSNYPPDETNPSNSYHQLYMIESKQEALRNLFATEGLWLEFQSADGSAPMKAQIKNVQINFAEGIWFTECNYTITCDADILYLNGKIYQGLPFNDLIQQASELWEISPNAQVAKNFDVTHTISAIGKRSFDALGNEIQPAWIAAKSFVQSQLVLGWDGVSNYSTISGNAIFNQSSLASGLLNFSTYNPYNLSRIETVDELTGSYQVVEKWDVSSTPSGSHIYTINTQRIVDDSYCSVITEIQGTINGYYDGLFNYDQRLAAAEYVWSTLSAPTGLLNIINSIYSGYSYNIQPRRGSIDYSQNDGRISYNYEFSNQLYQEDAFEQYTVSRKTSADNYITTYGIAGSVKGRRYDGDQDVLSPYKRAYNWWASLTGNNYTVLYDRILSYKYFPEASGIGLQPSPVSKNFELNEGEGVITYNLEWNNRQNLNNTDSDSVIETFQVSQHFSVDEGVTVYNLQGEVIGLNVTDNNPQSSKWNNCSGYFYNYVKPFTYKRVSEYYNISLPNSNPLVTEITEQPILGVINYSFEFRNTPLPLLPGVLSEHIIINEDNYNKQIQTIATIPIIGRLNGPIIQSMATTDIKARTLSIEAVLAPITGATLLDCFNAKPNYDSYALQLAPNNGYCQDWSDSWDYKQGRFSLNIKWIYE